MSVTNEPEHLPDARERVRDLLVECAACADPTQRPALLGRIADELERAATEITTANPETSREIVAVLRGQADMARFVAAVEGRDPQGTVG